VFGSADPRDLLVGRDIVVVFDPRRIDTGVDMLNRCLLAVGLVDRRGEIRFNMFAPAVSCVGDITSKPVGIDKGDITRLGDSVVSAEAVSSGWVCGRDNVGHVCIEFVEQLDRFAMQHGESTAKRFVLAGQISE